MFPLRCLRGLNSDVTLPLQDPWAGQLGRTLNRLKLLRLVVRMVFLHQTATLDTRHQGLLCIFGCFVKTR